MARPAVMAALARTATTMLGARAKMAANTAAASEIHDRNFRIRPGSVRTYFIATRAPMIRPTSWSGSTAAATEPRATSFRPNSSS